MGQLVTRTWFIYARDQQDNWLTDPIDSTIMKDDDCKYHMGKFKHKIFQFALGQEFQHCKKIYLYQGWRRVKCDLQDQACVITFSDTEAKEAWDTCKRSKLGKTFDQHFELAEQQSYMYIFKRKDK